MKLGEERILLFFLSSDIVDIETNSLFSSAVSININDIILHDRKSCFKPQTREICHTFQTIFNIKNQYEGIWFMKASNLAHLAGNLLARSSLCKTHA